MIARLAIPPLFAGLVVLAGCSTLADLPDRRLGSATLMRSTGQPAGTAQIVQVGDTVTLAVGLSGLSAGAHGLHLHTTGSCTGPEFASAGGHLNPLGRKHGALATGGKHAGDLPNVTIQPGGSGALTADLSGSPAEVRAWLFDADGTAIVVHANADDYMTDPTGNAGGRIACGVIRPT